MQGSDTAWMDYLVNPNPDQSVNFVCTRDLQNTTQCPDIPCVNELPVIRACIYCHLAGLDYLVSSLLIVLWRNLDFCQYIQSTLDTNKPYAHSITELMNSDKQYNFNSIASFFKFCESMGVTSEEIKVGMSQTRVKQQHQASIALAQGLKVTQLPQLIIA